MVRSKFTISGIIITGILCASMIFGQDVPIVPSKLGDTNNLVRVKTDITVCFEKYGKESVIRIDNKSPWILRMPVNEGGRNDSTLRQLPNGKEVAVLANGSEFSPIYGTESANGGRLKMHIVGDVGYYSFIAPSRVAKISLSNLTPTGVLFIPFNYEWEFDRTFQASPQHRVLLQLRRNSQPCDSRGG